MISIFKKDDTEFLAIARSDDTTDPGSLMDCWADPEPAGFDLEFVYVKPGDPQHSHGVEFVCHLHERSLLELTGDEIAARHAKFYLDAMYTDADKETFCVSLFQGWARWDGTHFVFLAPDPMDRETYGWGAARRLGEMYLLSRLIECENDTFRFTPPEATEAREEYLRVIGAID